MSTSHIVRAVRFPDGTWIAGCSCAQYMSSPYPTREAAVGLGSQEHQDILRGHGGRS